MNPYRIEGQKTAAFEIVDVLGDAPDVHCIPVGNAGNITAYWQGYREYQDAGRSHQAARACSASRPRAPRRSCSATPVEHPETVATAIRIGNPASWYGATAAASESGGGIHAVTDDEILAAYRFLAGERGGVLRAGVGRVGGRPAQGRRRRRPGATVVCTLTGHGLKDPDRAIAEIAVPSAGRRRLRRRPRRARPVSRAELADCHPGCRSRRLGRLGGVDAERPSPSRERT